MKKTLFAISAIAVLLGFTACTSENEILEPQVSGKTILKAYTEEATRTALSGDDETGYKVVWSEGDKITVGDKTFTLKEEDGGAGTTSGTFESMTSLTDGSDYTAYYPMTYDGTNWPTAQTYTAGNITGSPMKATFTYTAGGEEPSLKFQNEGGILRLNLKLKEGDDERSVSKVVVSSTQLDKDIELNCETAVALTEEGVPFHIAVPAKEYSDLKFTIYDNEGYKCTKSLSSGKTLTVERSQITPVNLTAKSWDYAGLCFTAEEAEATIGMKVIAGTVSLNIEYSTDLTTWKAFTPGTTDDIALAKVGDKVYFRATEKLSSFNSSENHVSFNIPKKVAASGNVMSLIDPTCQTTTIPSEYCFYRLFYSNCAGLTAAPELPATTLAANCYNAMFQECTSLKAAPELPATTLAKSCYYRLFYRCSSLTKAPAELPAKTLAANCYDTMFSTCSSLTTAPALPATTLAEKCYNSMFNGCKSLTAAPTKLPATTLANYCYQSMFNGCTSLTAAPELSATTLADYCYQYMFRECSSLTAAPELPATTLANYCYQGMFYGCTSLTAAPELSATTLASNCYSSMFRDCSSLTAAPELPAMNLVTSCYSSMFNGCKSLTAAPALLATTLANYCYNQMFLNCTYLSSVTCLATNISASSCVTYWLSPNTTEGTFTLYCASGMVESWAGKVPEGWTIEAPAPAGSKGKATATIGGEETDVNWVQLWKGGPKFAEYNVGATSPEAYGGYYCWGSSIDKDSDHAYNSGTDALTGNDDTATKLWGSKWRMPTQTELQALLDNCTLTWTEDYKDYNGTEVNGYLCTGKDAYSSNSIFLPAAGLCAGGSVNRQSSVGYYWSSTPIYDNAWYLNFDDSGYQDMNNDYRDYGCSVRAVLAE